ncbi:hypothetical protein ACOTVS_09865 [Aliarcobacter butzleri]
MKNRFLSLPAITVLTLNISCFAMEQKIKEVEKNICPILNIEVQFDEEKEIKEAFQSTIPNLATIYLDILKQYNKANNIDKYISKDGLIEVSTTSIYSTLVTFNYFATSEINNTEESVKMYEKAYKEVLNTIDANNPNWCELESYKHITDKYTNIKREK